MIGAIRPPGVPALQRGVALAMLLWFVAAMSIMVAGVVAVARVDLRLTQLQLHVAQTEAVGDGAAQLGLRDLLSLYHQGGYAGRGVVALEYTIGEHEIRMHLTPVTGLIDINQAQEELLVDLFMYGAGLDEAEAVSFAHRVMDWREESELKRLYGADESDYLAAGYDYGPRNGRFEVTEDLLQVLGMNREVYDRIAGSIHATVYGHSGVDPLSAPESVLLILAKGDRALVEQIVQAREQSPYDDIGTGGLLASDLLMAGSTSGYRVDAHVVQEDGKIYLRRRWADIGSMGHSGLPWRYLRTEPVRGINEIY